MCRSFWYNTNSFPFIDVDSSQIFQTIDGFGFTLTGGSAHVINQMDANSRASLLKELFGNGSPPIGISYLRLSIGSSDLNASVFSYDDMPAGQTDTGLAHFSLALRYSRVNTAAATDCSHQPVNKNYRCSLECAGLDEGQ